MWENVCTFVFETNFAVLIDELRQFELVDSPRSRRKVAVKNAALAAQAAATLFRGWKLDNGKSVFADSTTAFLLSTCYLQTECTALSDRVCCRFSSSAANKPGVYSAAHSCNLTLGPFFRTTTREPHWQISRRR